MTRLWWVLCMLIWLGSLPGDRADAASSETVTTEAASVRLITAEDGVAPGAQSLSAGLSVTLGDGWKTYWRSPGEVGLAPEIDWTGSENVASAEILWPAPSRFRAFDIENYGYAEAVTFPVRIVLEDPGAPVRLRASVLLLVCSDICIPLTADLALDVLPGGGVDAIAADEIALWSSRVPPEVASEALSVRAAITAGALTVSATRDAGWLAPDIFPELVDGVTFGAPDTRLSADRRTVWTRMPVMGEPPSDAALALTFADGTYAATVSGVDANAPPPAPPGAETGGLLWTIALALLGGLILNVMPCVLPVLSIKLGAAITAQDQSLMRIRSGFLVTALGTLAFMWALAGVTVLAQSIGYTVGWGMQFQNAFFLIAMVFAVGLFAANVAGAFEIVLPSGLMTRLDGADGPGYVGDFAAGAFAAILATPCSAPFLGTAIAFALTGGAGDVFVIFTALGVGLALPYLLIAAFPAAIRVLPKPGRWMLAVKGVLGVLLAGTVVWLLWVLAGVTGLLVAGSVALLLILAVAGIWALQTGRLSRHWVVPVAAIALGFATPVILPAADRPVLAADAMWVVFDREDITRRVAAGEVIFVDVTADWCLTCKANKALVLDRAPVADRLASDAVTAMRADWTRPDPEIAAYLEHHGRFGIPFNVVYGPGAPDGIPLSEVLTPGGVTDALDRAIR